MLDPLKIIKNETSGKTINISDSFRIANQQSFDDGKRRGQVEGLQKEITRIKEFIQYLELLQKRYRDNKTIQKIKEYYLEELNNFKIKE